MLTDIALIFFKDETNDKLEQRPSVIRIKKAYIFILSV